MKLTFFTSHKQNWGDLQAKYFAQFNTMLASGKDFWVDFGYCKSPKQLRGYHRLRDLIVPHAQDKWGETFTKEMVDELAKRSCGFVVKIGKNEICKSKTQATLQEMNRLIEKLCEICEFFGLKDYELTPQELRDINEYYKT